MPHSKTGAYDRFDRISEAKDHYKRCRHTKDFILSDEGVKAEDPVCVVCGNKIQDDPKNHPGLSKGYRGNRCSYYPKTKKVACLHYLCSWENIMNHIYCGDRLV